jgi:hypothetical protein
MTTEFSPNVISGRLLPPSPPAEKTTARQDQAGKSGSGDPKLVEIGLLG